MAATIIIYVIAALHVWFFVLESILWRTPLALKTMKMTQARADATAQMAVNQGVYNLILAAGLGWAACSGSYQLQVFFLGAVLVAGIVGGLTATKTILLVQALPAAIGLALVMAAH